MYILGINAYHAGSSACLIKDGLIVAAAEEERFNRNKYWSGFPVQSVKFVLEYAGISAYDLDHVGISRNPNANLMKKILFMLAKRPSLDLIRNRLANASEIKDLKTTLATALDLDSGALRMQFHNVEHHRAHMASAFFVSPFQDASIVSVDGMGDFVSTMWGKGSGNQLDVRGAVNYPHSLGFFYTAISQWLGFPQYGDEGKVMGLAPYGKPRYMDKMRKIVRLQRDGTFELDLEYFIIHTKGVTMSWEDGSPILGNLFSAKLIDILGEPRKPYGEITELHRDVAASLQEMLEEAEFALLRELHRETECKALCIAGGVGLNSAFNGKVLPSTEFEEIYIQPAAGDAGTAMGVCYYIWNHTLGQPRTQVLHDPYLGPGYSDDALVKVLDKYGLQYVRYDGDELVRRAAGIVAEGNVLGWFQGRMEWGPGRSATGASLPIHVAMI